MKHAQQDFVPHRQDPVDLAARKRGMQEETDLDVGLGLSNLLSQHGRQKHQVVVVDPDQVAILDFASYRSSKKPVRFFVRVPCRFVEGDLTRMVVEERPEDGICHRTCVSASRFKH